MKQIKMDIPDFVPASAIEQIQKEIKALNEPQLTVSCELPHLKDRTLYINYPSYFEDRDIFITGALIGAVIYKKPWGIKK